MYTTTTVDVTINRETLTSKDVSISIADCEWNGGSAVTPTATITLADGTVLTQGTDFEITSDSTAVGDGTATITFKGNYIGSISDQKFTVIRAKLDKPTAIEGLTYNKAEQTGVTYSSDYITNKYYTVTAGSVTGTNKGSYSATFTLDENHRWSDETTAAYTVNWSIGAKSSSDRDGFTITLDDSACIYNGKEQKPSPVIKDGDYTLEEGVDYELVYSDNIEASDDTATVTIKYIGNYGDGADGDCVDKNFTISPLTVTTPSTVTEEQIKGVADQREAQALAESLCTKEGDGFIVWDYTGFETISGKTVGVEINPTATLYVNLGGTITAVSLTLSDDGTTLAVDKSVTASDVNYTLTDSNLIGINIGLGDEGTKAAGGATSDKYDIVSQQERDRREIVEKVNALKASASAATNERDFYDKDGNCDYAAYIAEIEKLISDYDTDYSGSTAEGEASGEGGGTLSDARTAFEDIENSYNFVNGLAYTDKNGDDSDTDTQAAVKSAFETVKAYGAAATDEAKLAALGKDRAALETTYANLSDTITAYQALGDEEKAYLEGEYKALSVAKKAAAEALLNQCLTDIGNSDLTEEQQKTIKDIIDGNLSTIDAMSCPLSDADNTTMDNIVNNICALTDAALNLAGKKSGETDEDVLAVLNGAVDEVFALATSDMGTTTGLDDKITAINDSADYITDAIKKEKANLADYKADGTISDEAKSAIESTITAAITDLKALDLATDSTGLADLKAKVDNLTTDTTDIKAAAIAKIGKLAFDSDGIKRRADVQAEIKEAIAEVQALTSTGSDLQDDVDEIYDGVKAKVEAIDELDALKEKVAASGMTDEQKKALTALLDDGIDKIGAYGNSLSDDDKTIISNILANLTAQVEAALECDGDKNGASDNVKELLSAAIDNIIKISGDVTADPSATDGIKDLAENVTDNKDLIAEAIKAEEKALADYKADKDISDGAKDTLSGLIGGAIKDLLAIDFAAGTDTDTIKDEIAAVTTDTTDLKAAAIAKLDKSRLDENGNEKSAAVIAEINEAIGKIEGLTSTGDDLKANIDSILSSEGKIVSGIEELEEMLAEVESGSLSSEAKTALTSAINSGIKAIGDLTYDEDNAVDETAISNVDDLLEYKKSAISEIDSLKSGRSSAVANIGNEAIKNIAGVEIATGGTLDDAKAEIDTLKENAEDAMNEQIIRDDGVSAIEKYVKDNGISTDDERVSAKIAEAENGIKNLKRNSGESLTSYASRVAEIVNNGKAAIRGEQFRHDNPVTEKSNDSLTASDKEALAAAESEYNGLTAAEKAAVDSLYQPEYSSFASLKTTKDGAADFNSRKAEILAEIEAMKESGDSADVLAVIEAQKAIIDAMEYGDGEKSADEVAAKLAELEAAREKAIDEINLAKYKQKNIDLLRAERDRLIATGQYSEKNIAKLNEIFSAAEANINAVTSSDDWMSVIDGYYDKAMADYAEVPINIVSKGDVSENGGGEDDDYDENHDYDNETGDGTDGGNGGYWGVVTNEDGMTPGIELVIEKNENSEEIGAAVKKAVSGGNIAVQEGSSMTVEEAENNIRGKELKATFDVYLIKQGEVIRDFNGTYTVKILLPEDMRNMSGLQVVYVADDGTVEVLDTSSEGNYLVFNTSHFSEFVIVGEKEINLLWIAIVEGVIILASAAAIFIILRKNGKKGEKAASVALPALLTVILPDGIIPVIIVLGVVAVAALVALAVVIVRSKKSEENDGKAGKDDEKK